MKLKSIIQSILAATLLSTSCYALAADEIVICPGPETIKQFGDKLDTVSIMSTQRFNVWNLNAIKAAELSWHIVDYVKAEDLSTALLIGQKDVSNISQLISNRAINGKDSYICGYLTNDNVNVVAVSFKNENAQFKFATFDFKALNAGSH